MNTDGDKPRTYSLSYEIIFDSNTSTLKNNSLIRRKLIRMIPDASVIVVIICCQQSDVGTQHQYFH